MAYVGQLLSLHGKIQVSDDNTTRAPTIRAWGTACEPCQVHSSSNWTAAGTPLHAGPGNVCHCWWLMRFASHTELSCGAVTFVTVSHSPARVPSGEPQVATYMSKTAKSEAWLCVKLAVSLIYVCIYISQRNKHAHGQIADQVTNCKQLQTNLFHGARECRAIPELGQSTRVRACRAQPYSSGMRQPAS
jgi:hypothetical protein